VGTLNTYGKVNKMFTYTPYENPKIESSTSSFGRYVIKLDDVTFRFFWKKKEAQEWLNTYLEGK
jgi:hypothetical protein